MEFATPIVTPIVNSLIVSVMKQLGFVFSCENYVRKMRVRLSELNNKALSLENKMEAKDANNQFVPDHVPYLLAQVKAINNEAKDIQIGGNGCSDIKKRYKVGKGSYDILKKIDELVKQESNIKWTNEQIPLGLVISSTKPSPSKIVHDDDGMEHIFKSRQSIFKDVLKSLEPDNNIQKMAICGIGGVGKTKMMEDLKKVVEKRGMFKWILKVAVGRKYNPSAIQRSIAQWIGEPLTEITEDTRADRLAKRFDAMSKNGTQKILIILDDIWKEVDLKVIGLSSPLPKGFKLLLTSRDEKVCRKMDIETSSIFKIVGLEESEAKSLFFETVRLPSGDGELHNIGEDILKKCNGLPKAIRNIALILKGENKDAWEQAQLYLRDNDLNDLAAAINCAPQTG